MRGPVSRWRSLPLAAAFLGAAAGTYAFFVQTVVGQRSEATAFAAGQPVLPQPVRLEVFGALRPGVILALAVLAVLLGLGALRAGRWGRVLRAVAVAVVSVGLAEVAKTILPRPLLADSLYPVNTLPSGHTAAATSLVLACAMLLPPGWSTRLHRVGRALAALVMTLAGVASVVSYAHRPSDVVAALFLVGAVSAVSGVLAGARWTPPSRSVVAGAALLSAAALAGYAGLVVAGPGAAEPLISLAPLLGVLAASGWVCATVYEAGRGPGPTPG